MIPLCYAHLLKNSSDSSSPGSRLYFCWRHQLSRINVKISSIQTYTSRKTWLQAPECAHLRTMCLSLTSSNVFAKSHSSLKNFEKTQKKSFKKFYFSRKPITWPKFIWSEVITSFGFASWSLGKSWNTFPAALDLVLKIIWLLKCLNEVVMKNTN